MSELEEKLSSILKNPNMMQQIMGMANMLSAGQASETNDSKQPSESLAVPSVDPKAIQAISGLLQQTGTDKNQEFLLKALHPYLSRNKISKLERAMHAARMASAASAFLGSGGLRLLTSR